MPLSPRAEWVLNNLSLGEIQAGVDFIVPLKVPKAPRSAGERDYKIVRSTKRVEGTRIPASTIVKFKSGEWTPRRKTIDKLEKLYYRHQYQTLKSSGLSTQQARRFFRRSPQEVATIANEYAQYIRTIASNKGVDPFYVLYGFTLSQRIMEDWDFYVSSRGYTPPPSRARFVRIRPKTRRGRRHKRKRR